MKQSATYKPEIEGIRGGACLIVLLGHSVAGIFPAIYFGNAYQAHSGIENIIHETPLNLLFNGSAMVMIFFIISGYFIGRRVKHKNLIDFVVRRYIRYVPMVTVGILLGAIVMWFGMVNSIRLAEYSYAGEYVRLYNNFEPTVFGRDGIVLDALFKVFLVGSDYNSVLWYISISFLGEIIFTAILNLLQNKKMQLTIMCVVIVSLWIVGVKFWQLQYLSGMAVGILIAILDIKIDGLKAGIIFAVGVVLLSFEDKSPAGIYLPLQQISEWIIPIWSIGGAMVLLGVMSNRILFKVFSSRRLVWFGKYSFGIYALQWPIIISISCGGCLFLIERGINYNLAGWSGIFLGGIITVVLAVVVQKKIYTPVYKILLDIWNNIRKK